jgi:signal recognition particle GTPase
MRFHSFILAGLVLLGTQGFAQTPLLSPSLPGARRSVSPNPSAAQNPSASKETEAERKARFQELTAVLKDRIAEASDKVMSKIIDQEKDLRMRLSYFERQDRLDPNNFATKEEIQNWQKLVDQFQESRDKTAKVYGDASEKLEAALLEENIAPTLATAIRKEIISTFPWDDIVKKDDLLTTYVGYHRQLLSFFDQNWKTWNSAKPYFADQKTEADYEKLCQQITSAGKEIDTLYKKDNF